MPFRFIRNFFADAVSRLQWVCRSVCSHIAARRPNRRLVNRIKRVPDDLPSSKQPSLRPSTHDNNIMTQLPQPLDNLWIHCLLYTDRPVHRLARLGKSRTNAYPRRIQRLLGIQLADNLAKENLYMSLRLHEAAHDTKRRMERAVL